MNVTLSWLARDKSRIDRLSRLCREKKNCSSPLLLRICEPFLPEAHDVPGSVPKRDLITLPLPSRLPGYFTAFGTAMDCCCGCGLAWLGAEAAGFGASAGVPRMMSMLPLK